MTEAELNALIEEAIAAWNGVPSSSVSVTRNTSTSSLTRADYDNDTLTGPLIICDTNFSGANGGADANSIPAATGVSLDTQGRINGAIISLNAQGAASAEISQLSDDLLVVIIAHELGHALGLGHSSQADALMYYSVANKTEATLALDDIDGISFLYPRNEFGPGAYGCAAVHGARSPKSLLWLFVFLGIVLPAGRLVYFRPARLRALRAQPL